MGQVSTIGLDLAKSIFQVHGADASGAVVFRKRLRRSQVRPFLAAQLYRPRFVRHRIGSYAASAMDES